MTARFRVRESAIFWSLLGAMLAMVAVLGPVLTSDGPAHAAIARFLAMPGSPARDRLFEINPVLSPNALGHYLLAALLRVLPPLAAEQVTQAICLAAIPLGARAVLRRLNPDAVWLSLFFFPAALQITFFMGLYNFCLSMGGSLLSIWGFLRFRERPSAARGIALALLLLATLACQAAGWMEAVAAIGTIAGVESLLRWQRGAPFLDAVRFPAAVLAILAPGAMLFALFAARGGGGQAVRYGASLPERLVAVLQGQAFAPIGRTTALTGFLAGLTLACVAIAGAVALKRGPAVAGDPLRIGVCLVPVSFLAVLAVVPDEAGGGWTHVWRAQPFPYIGLAFACAMLPVPGAVRTVAMAIATGCGLAGIGLAAWVQAVDVPPVVREFTEIDAAIGPRCTLAPVLSQFKLDPENSARLFYHPLFHLANRLESRGDRVVLFSYVARLPMYPARFRADADPQRLLFGWEKGQRDTRVRQIDIPGFEAATGIPVDYVFLWDVPQGPGPYARIRERVARYELAMRTSGGRGELYRRPGAGGCEDRR